MPARVFLRVRCGSSTALACICASACVCLFVSDAASRACIHECRLQSTLELVYACTLHEACRFLIISCPFLSVGDYAVMLRVVTCPD